MTCLTSADPREPAGAQTVAAHTATLPPSYRASRPPRGRSSSFHDNDVGVGESLG